MMTCSHSAVWQIEP